MKPDTSTPKRSIAKGISFETVSNLAGFGIAYVTFGNLGGCAIFTGICFVVKLVLFYCPIKPRPTAVRPWGLSRSGVPPSARA
jgi:hypothetical protein